MNAAIGWLLALVAMAAGYVGYGWRGVALALTVTVFWLLLQFSRALRAMRAAAQRPVGSVGNAVMLQSRVRPGMRLVDVIGVTKSLGRRVDASADADTETWAWTDGGGDTVQITLHRGRVAQVRLLRAAAAHAEADGA